MSYDMNVVHLTGRLGADPELRYTPNDVAVASVNIAVNSSYKNRDGERVDATEWVPIVAWNKVAELLSQYACKGSRIAVTGKLQTRSWEDKDSGQTRYKTEVVVSDIVLLDSRKDDDQDAAPSPVRKQAVPSRQQAAGARVTPQRQAAPAKRQQQRYAEPVDIDDDDIPF